MENNVPIGLLRYNLFWDNIPFCTMLFICSNYQRKGYGKKLIDHWEHDMKLQGYEIVMTSTRVDEYGQHFYKQIGYQECGCLTINFSKHKQPKEIFFIKDIN